MSKYKPGDPIVIQDVADTVAQIAYHTGEPGVWAVITVGSEDVSTWHESFFRPLHEAPTTNRCSEVPDMPLLPRERATSVDYDGNTRYA